MQHLGRPTGTPGAWRQQRAGPAQVGHDAARESVTADRLTGYRFRHDDTPSPPSPEPSPRRPRRLWRCCWQRRPARATEPPGPAPTTKAALPAGHGRAHRGARLLLLAEARLDEVRQPDECADLRVPLDYAKPDPVERPHDQGAARVPATRPGQAASAHSSSTRAVPAPPAIELRRGAPTTIVGTQVRRYFDVVGFDPRGVGGSAPLDCLATRQLDRFMAADPTPDDAAEEQALLAAGQGHGRRLRGEEPRRSCRTCRPPTRPATWTSCGPPLGDAQLNYLGKSYGTFLGSTYAGLFPQARRPFRPRRGRAPRPHQCRDGRGSGPRLRARHPHLRRRTASRRATVRSAHPSRRRMQRIRRLPQVRSTANPLPRATRARHCSTEGWASSGSP